VKVVLAHQPHFINQPENLHVFWGYALFPDRFGDYVEKPMSECNGEEILIELFSHLRLGGKAQSIIDPSICIPRMTPSRVVRSSAHLGESLHLAVTLSPSVPQDKLREGSLIAREMLRFAQHDKLAKNSRRGVLIWMTFAASLVSLGSEPAMA
jgi:hypothetical protein